MVPQMVAQLFVPEFCDGCHLFKPDVQQRAIIEESGPDIYMNYYDLCDTCNANFYQLFEQVNEDVDWLKEGF